MPCTAAQKKKRTGKVTTTEIVVPLVRLMNGFRPRVADHRVLGVDVVEKKSV